MSERQDLDLQGEPGPEQTMDERDGGRVGLEMSAQVAPRVRVLRCQSDERGSLRNATTTIKIPVRSSFREAQMLEPR